MKDWRERREFDRERRRGERERKRRERWRKKREWPRDEYERKWRDHAPRDPQKREQWHARWRRHIESLQFQPIRKRMFAWFIATALMFTLFNYLLTRYVTHSAWLTFIVAVCVLAMSSSGIARRLTQPLEELEYVAESLGNGDLTARVPWWWMQYREVTTLANALNLMADRIEQQIEGQRALLAAVSHEMRTPLARMRLLLERVREGKMEAGDEVEQEIIGLDQLVGDLLATSRIDFAAIQKTDLVAADIAVRALETCEEDFDKLDVDEDIPPFSGDPTLVLRAITNLVTNARRHAGGLTELRVRHEEGHVIFEAHDEGPGFAPGDEERLFQPFEKGQSTGSLGLGLTLIRRIAEAHGGSAKACNREEKGACVSISFPTSNRSRA